MTWIWFVPKAKQFGQWTVFSWFSVIIHRLRVTYRHLHAQKVRIDCVILVDFIGNNVWIYGICRSNCLGTQGISRSRRFHGSKRKTFKSKGKPILPYTFDNLCCSNENSIQITFFLIAYHISRFACYVQYVYMVHWIFAVSIESLPVCTIWISELSSIEGSQTISICFSIHQLNPNRLGAVTEKYALIEMRITDEALP